MSDEKTKAFAKVSLTVEVVCSQPWGSDETIANIWKVAAREAMDRVTSALHKFPDIRILSEPVVTAVLAPERKP